MRRLVKVGEAWSPPNLELHWRIKKLVEEIRCEKHRKRATIKYPISGTFEEIEACCAVALDAAEAVVRIHYGVPKEAEKVN